VFDRAAGVAWRTDWYKLTLQLKTERLYKGPPFLKKQMQSKRDAKQGETAWSQYQHTLPLFPSLFLCTGLTKGNAYNKLY
jgi:hypothetical protein